MKVTIEFDTNGTTTKILHDGQDKTNEIAAIDLTLRARHIPAYTTYNTNPSNPMLITPTHLETLKETYTTICGCIYIPTLPTTPPKKSNYPI